MKKQKFQYGISGYRWAPANFHATIAHVKHIVQEKKHG